MVLTVVLGIIILTSIITDTIFLFPCLFITHQDSVSIININMLLYFRKLDERLLHCM